MANSQERPAISEPIIRAVRQKCGFGCVICGLPIYEYDHFVPYSEVLEHKTENLFLLCPMHHAEKTKGLLSDTTYKTYCDNPTNIVNGLSAPYNLHFEGSDMSFTLGECNLIINNLNPEKDELTPLVINNERVISFRIIEGQLLLTIKLYNQDGELLLLIEDNELIYNTGSWDIEFVGRNLKIREAAREIIFDLNILPPGNIKINRGQFYKDGYELIVEDGKMISKSLTAVINNVVNARVLFSFGNCNEELIGLIHNGPLKDDLI